MKHLARVLRSITKSAVLNGNIVYAVFDPEDEIVITNNNGVLWVGHSKDMVYQHIAFSPNEIEIIQEDYIEESDMEVKIGKKSLNEILSSQETDSNPLNIQVGGDHFKKYAIQPIEYIQKNGLNFCQGNIIKYVTRYKDKDGIKDLKKAKHYIDLLIKFEYGE